MIKGVIFDLDGVLASTDEMHYKAWKRLASELGITDFTREDNELQRGVSRMASLEIVLNKGEKVYCQEEKNELAERKNNYYIELLAELDESAALEGAEDALKYLRNRGILIGVGSASKNTYAILEKTKLLPYIDEISCGLDVTKSKPDPEVFLVAADKLKLKPNECLVVEDSAAGVEAARAAGMKSLGVGPYSNTLGADIAAAGLHDRIDWERIL